MTDPAALLRELTAIPGISGSEDGIARAVADRLRPLADAVHVDALANVIARFGPADAPAIAICAHLDTIGFLVKDHLSADALRVVTVGGINLKAAPGTAVRITGEDGVYDGLIGVRSQHQSGLLPDKIPEITDLYLHVDSAAKIGVGSMVTYAPTYLALGDIIAAPYLDDRAGVAALIALAERFTAAPPAVTVYLIGTTQEETTCLGAKFALRGLPVDAALFIDGTVSYDTPETNRFGAVALGAGPVLTKFLYIRGLAAWHVHPGLWTHLRTLAESAGVAYQVDVVHGLMADSLGAAEHGIPSAVIGLPMRGKHAALESMNIRDWAVTVDLLAAVCAAPLPPLIRG